jgi:rubrerythrin
MVFSNLELTEFDIRASQPDKIITKLKPHQLSSLYKATMMENTGEISYKIRNFHNYSQLFFDNPNIINPDDEETDITIKTNIGILGDKVGYGKTLLALSLIASNKLDNIYINPIYIKNFTSHSHYNYLNISVSNNLLQKNPNIINTTLVIVPRGPVYVQWEKTILEKTNLKIISITNMNFIKSNLPKFDGSNQKEIMNFFESFDLVLIKNTTLKIFIDFYSGCNFIKNWKRMMIDEAHDIINKIPTYMNYYYLWLISGTYNDIFTKTGYSQYISGIKELMNKNSIASIIVKNTNEFIKNSFDIPEPNEKYYLCKLPTNFHIAKMFLNTSVLEKINANDFAGAIRELGGKNETEDNIIELVSKDLKRNLFNLEMEKSFINSQDINEEEKELKINNINVKIEIQNNKIKELTNRISSFKDNSCAICMDILQNPVLLECTHMFCGRCIFEWYNRNNNKNCPTCRMNIKDLNKLTAIVEKNKKNEINEKEEIFSKEDTLLKIIDKNPDGKFLVFSKIDNGFETFKKKLNDANIKFEFLKGTTSHMLNVLERFKNGITKIILLNTQYAGSGIEINYATDVIIFHTMGLDKQQAIGRAQRVGRTSILNIHNLCYEDEME